MIKLFEKIGNRRLRLAALGSGYVGLPTALFSDVGFSVLAVDVRPELVSAINEGLSSISEPDLASSDNSVNAFDVTYHLVDEAKFTKLFNSPTHLSIFR